MASSSISLFGARKITLKTETITPSDGGRRKFAYTKIRYEDGNDYEITETSCFHCNGITIEDADKFDVFFVKNADGETRLEISLPDSAFGREDSIENVEIPTKTEEA